MDLDKKDEFDKYNAAVAEYENSARSREQMHMHDCAELGICLEGSGVFYIGKAVNQFNAGCVSFILPGEMHIANSPTKRPSKWKFMSFNISEFDKKDFKSGGNVFEESKLFELAKLAFFAAETGDTELFCALMKAVICYLKRISAKKTEAKSSGVYEYNRLLPAIDYMSLRYAQDVQIDYLAKLCKMSSSLFFRIFKKTFCMTPNQYLTTIRIENAANLLTATDMSVTDISLGVGYETQSAFYRNFFKIKKMSPRRYRKYAKEDIG